MVDITKIYGSIVKRIVGVLVIFIFIPLVIDAVLLIKRDGAIKEKAAVNQLNLMDESFQIYFDQGVKTSFFRLRESRNIEGVSTSFAFDKTLTCIDSTISEMIGKKNFFPSELKSAFERGKRVFIGLNPYTKQDEIFILLEVKETLRGLSITQSKFLLPFKELSPFSFNLVEKGQTPSEALVKSTPIQDSNFSLQVAINHFAISQFEGSAIYRHLAILLAAIVLIGGLFAILLIRKMAKPFHELSSVMVSVANQDYSKRYRQMPFGFEINALGTHFNQMLQSLLAHMEEAKNEKVRRELISQELHIGREIQHELLPKEIPRFPGIQLGSRFLSAKEVAGDFFDVFPLNDESFFFVIADGSDKGISACLYSLIVRSMLRSLAANSNHLATILKEVNHLFCGDTGDSGNFVTAWMGIFDTRDDTLSYTNAGHLPAALINNNGEIEELTTKGIALGVDQIEHVEVKTVRLPTGSALFLYSDGVTDAHNKKGELFGKSRLFDYLKTSCQLEPELLVGGLLTQIEEFTSGSEPFDDLTMLSLKKA